MPGITKEERLIRAQYILEKIRELNIHIVNDEEGEEKFYHSLLNALRATIHKDDAALLSSTSTTVADCQDITFTHTLAHFRNESWRLLKYGDTFCI